MADRTLGDLVGSGADGAHLVFGDGRRQPGGSLAERGRRWFGPDGDPGTVVALLTNDAPSVELVLGAILSGARLVSLPLPARGADPVAYAGFVRGVMADHSVETVVANDDVTSLLASVEVPATSHSTSGRVGSGPSPPEFELVQFTSGSTGPPKPVALSGAALAANILAILEVLEPRPGDVTVSWLPLSHDMGLIGMLLASVVATGPAWVGSADIVLLEPTTFLRSPRSWMDAIDRWRGSFTAAPDFAFRMAAQHRPPEGCGDLSSLRCAIVGGEIVQAATLTEFTVAFGPDGLDERALCPGYGLAEVGVAATLVRPDETWSTVALDHARLADRRCEPPVAGGSRIDAVVCGRPLPGYDVVAGSWPGSLAPITVQGPSVGRRGSTGPRPSGAGATVETGDLGFVVDGQLVVCGRHDDHVVVRGRNVHAPTIEAALSAVDGVRAGRVGLVAGPTGELTVALETSGDHADVRREVVRTVVQMCGARPHAVVVLDPGSLPMTASGKLQRSALVRRLFEPDDTAGRAPIDLR